MEINIYKSIKKSSSTVILPFYKNETNLKLVKELTGMKRLPPFVGDFQETITLFRKDNDAKVIITGLGLKADNQKICEVFRRIAFFTKVDKDTTITLLFNHLDDNVVMESIIGFSLGSYDITINKKESTVKPILNLDIIHQSIDASKIQEARMTATCMMDIMKLVDTPSNIKTPAYIANHAAAGGKKYGYKTKIIHGEDLKKNGLNALYAIGQGSVNPPAFIIMEYHGNKKGKTIGLVGKGISFDTGGISIKPSTNMHHMKSDMGGAAAVIGTINLAASLKMPINIIGIIPSAENAVDGNSIKPGDIVTAYSGHTIEIIDTDAEGRVVLADGLSYLTKNYQPDAIIDLATLTGSCVATLGSAAAGLFTNNEELASQLTAAGFQSYDKVWRLPLWDDYKDHLHSDIADIKNLSGKPVAGAISAAKFLEFFTDNHACWAHLDIAGVAFTDNEYSKMRSATAYGVRLLKAWLHNQCH